ncbi:MAG: ATP-grasp domain-containing protein [Patescibacteria group bacterium]
MPALIKKIAVLYNSINEVKKGNPLDKLADDDNFQCAKDVYECLLKLGYEADLVNVTRKTLNILPNLKADLIFNLLEGFDDLPNSFCSITTFIEALGIPMTGSSSFSGAITIDKARTKDYLVKYKIPTPNYQLFISSEDYLKYSLRYPLITKPNSADSSIGITQESVVKNFNELKDRINIIKEEYKDATLAEEYIEGRELEVFTVKKGRDLVILPVLEGLFIPDANRKWNICDFEHKWGPNSYCDEACPAELTDSVLGGIQDIVYKTQKTFDITGYFRLDLRLSKDNVPYVIEVNVNPGLDKSVMASKLAAAGLSYELFVQLIIDSAVEEYESVKQPSTSFLEKANLIES